ncbi:MAG: MarR family transcriptional regulator [Planctomycetia bacterium]|nr:MarR family transcriptional regulator [Planctomycetia bacterium]
MKDLVLTNGNGARTKPSNGSATAGHAANGQPADVGVQSDAEQLIGLLLSLAREVFVVDDAAGELPLRQVRVCALLHDEPRSMSWLGRELGVSLSAMTQIADRLERAKLVTRQFEGTDRRVRSLQLTPRGRRIMQRREQVRVQRASELMKQLTPQERKRVLSACQTLLKASHKTESSDE